MKIGLRVDVDTYRGTRDGVPELCRVLAEYSLHASFFFSVGPDNMGRHIWRLLKPSFLIKMMRSNAAGLYGWDILLRGVFWPGPRIGKSLREQIKNAADAGHEIGLHAWDHHAWQNKIADMSAEQVRQILKQGWEALAAIVQPTCSAAPAWRGTDTVLLEKERLPALYHSDCRGSSIFLPKVNGSLLLHPQIPVTLPTYDEVIGRHGVTNENYNAYIISQLRENALNVLTIHAEVEGIACKQLFRDFLDQIKALGHELVPLGTLLSDLPDIPAGTIARGTVPGREGWVAVQTTSQS